MRGKGWIYLGVLALFYVAVIGGERQWFPPIVSMVLTLPMVLMLGWDNWKRGHHP